MDKLIQQSHDLVDELHKAELPAFLAIRTDIHDPKSNETAPGTLFLTNLDKQSLFNLADDIYDYADNLDKEQLNGS